MAYPPNMRKHVKITKLKLPKEKSKVFRTTRALFIDWFKKEFKLWEWGPDGVPVATHPAKYPENQARIQLVRLDSLLEIHAFVIATTDTITKLNLHKFLSHLDPPGPEEGLVLFRLGVVVRFEVQQISDIKAEVTMGYADYEELPELAERAESLWSEVCQTFGDEEKQTTDRGQAGEGGRYRLTKDDIKFRKKKVKEAAEIKKQDPSKYWKEIALEVDVPERTLRDWRHNPVYK